MKRSLLLTSVIALLCAAAHGQQIVQPSRAAQAVSPSHGPHSSAAASSSKKKRRKHTPQKATGIVHTSPDQQKIDSIKAAKQKGKK